MFTFSPIAEDILSLLEEEVESLNISHTLLNSTHPEGFQIVRQYLEE